MSSKNISMVFSAPMYMKLLNNGERRRSEENHRILVEGITEGIQWIKERCRVILDDDSLKLCILYNAYTEERAGEYIRSVGNLSFDNLYADSGGLQVVTRGQVLTNELKREIYRRQRDSADFGFCFDEIPLGIKEGVDPNNGAHRSQTASKLFSPQGFKDSAEKTALNVKSQCEMFLHEGNAQAFYILQGNEQDEMYRWFETGVNVIGRDMFDAIRGVAPADTCMGNGTLETANMMAAYHRIVKDFGPDYAKNHLHLLGVGSPSRLLPAILLKRAGFLKEDLEISFDSSSQSMALVMGNFTDSDGTRPNKDRRKEQVMFGRFYDDLGFILEKAAPTMTRQWFMDWLASNWDSSSKIIQTSPPEKKIAMRIFVTLICVWQSLGFMQRLRNELDSDETRFSPVGQLSQVKDMDDFRAWEREFARFVKSKKIDRRPDSDLNDLFQ